MIKYLSLSQREREKRQEGNLRVKPWGKNNVVKQVMASLPRLCLSCTFCSKLPGRQSKIGKKA